MNKDVIYIDVDDDVTAIIGKMKQAKEKVVALVPPKRAGALQSAVNLRLIERIAKNEKKHLVLVTHSPALIALAASAKIPVAKNLQSKPELAEVPALAVDEGDDIIDGASLPVGDHAESVKVSDSTKKTSSRSDAIESVDINLDDPEDGASSPVTVHNGTQEKTKPAKNRSSKIPNFDSFRKRLFLGVGGGAVLVALLVWMFIFAPAATVVVTARTNPVPVSTSVTLVGSEATDYESGTVRSILQEKKKDESVEFEGTGQRDIGDKAAGTLEVRRLSQTDYTVPAGTRFTADGFGFITQSAVTIPASVPCFPTYCAQTASVEVKAESGGTEYNGVDGAATGSDGTQATFDGPTSGGTTKIARVVTAEDIERARGQLIGKSTDEARDGLIAEFTGGEKVIPGSFEVKRGDPVSSPARDQAIAEGTKATLTVPTTYSVYAIPSADLETYLRTYLEDQFEDDARKVYNTGIDEVVLSNFRKEGDAITVTIGSVGRVGPEIVEEAIKEKAKGKIYGEVQSSIESIDGVREVDVKFSYFWVRTVPNNPDKINVIFEVQDE